MIHVPEPWRWKGYQMQRYQWSFVACPRIASWRWLALTLSEAFLCKCCPEAKRLWNGNLREEWALLSLIFTKMGRAFHLHSYASRLSGWDGLKFKRVVLPPPATMPELARGRPPQSERTFTPNLYTDWHSKPCLYEEQTISARAYISYLLPWVLPPEVHIYIWLPKDCADYMNAVTDFCSIGWCRNCGWGWALGNW